jgi:hypothetical protein
VCFFTDEVCTVLEATAAGGALLGTSARFLRGRNLLLFFAGERDRTYHAALNAACGGPRAWETIVQPRNSRRLPVSVTIGVGGGPDGRVRLTWHITRLSLTGSSPTR